MAEQEPEKYWWANQFENLSNFRANLTGTGPEIWEQCAGNIDGFVTAAGTGGTIAGCSVFLKSKNPNLKVYLADPDGSGLYSYLKTGTFATEGSSLTEGIGIMRLVGNFSQAMIDNAYKVKDQELLTIARYVREEDGLILGSSSALNVAAALRMAIELGRGKRIVTFACDLGERSYSKLYNPTYLREQGLNPEGYAIEELVQFYRAYSA
jgi:cysteine synthase A